MQIRISIHQFILILAAGLFAGAGNRVEAQSETLSYELFANKGKVGKWVITRVDNGAETVYESRREVVFKLLKSIRTVTTQKSVFRNDLLYRSELEVAVNGDVRRRILVSAENGEYLYQEEGKPNKHIVSEIRFTNIRLFFEPPVGEDAIFFDRIGEQLPIRQIDSNTYGVLLENGEENRYDYYEGRVARAVLEDGILHTYLRLRKYKGDDEPGVVER